MPLSELARTYLEAGGYTVIREAGSLMELRRSERDTFLLWVDETERPASSSLDEAARSARDAEEAALLDVFKREMTQGGPGTRGVYLTPRRRGLSQSFVATASVALGEGGIRVPVEFFDSEYRHERGGEGTQSVIANLSARAAAIHRVPQPFSVRHSLRVSDRAPGGTDLVEYVAEKLVIPPREPRLWLIDGSAGLGKTVAFNALVSKVYRRFTEAKAQRTRCPRPIAFNERHLRHQAAGRVDDLIAALMATELARPVTAAQFRWLLTGGFSTWMFDGLDEVYAGNPAFFDQLSALLDAPGSVAQIVICTRDSLLTSSDAVQGFVQARLGRGQLEVLELAPWDETAWRELAGAQLPPEGVDAFVSAIQASPSLTQLASLPFYCAELVKRSVGGTPLTGADEFAVMGQLVDRMLEREYAKDIFAWSDFVGMPDEIRRRPLTDDVREQAATLLEEAGRQQVVDLIELLAHMRHRTPAGADAVLPVAMIRDLLTMNQPLPDDPNSEDAVLALVQFAFFGLGERAGSVDFSHPLLGEYLAGRYALRLLGQSHSAGAIRQAVGPLPVVPDSGFDRFMTRAVEADDALHQALVDALQSGALRLPHVEAAARRWIAGGAAATGG